MMRTVVNKGKLTPCQHHMSVQYTTQAWQDDCLESNEDSIEVELYPESGSRSEKTTPSVSFSSDSDKEGEYVEEEKEEGEDNAKISLQTSSEIPSQKHKSDSQGEPLGKPTKRKRASKESEKVPRGYFTTRVFKVAKMRLEKTKGIMCKKTSVVPRVFASQQSFYMRSLMNTLFSAKVAIFFSRILNRKNITKNNQTTGSICKLLKSRDGGGPILYWNKDKLAKALLESTNKRNITTSDVAEAIRKDKAVSPYFKDIEIPFGANIGPALQTKSELLKLKRVSKEVTTKTNKRKASGLTNDGDDDNGASIEEEKTKKVLMAVQNRKQHTSKRPRTKA